MKHKKCSKCGKELTLDCFNKNKTKKDGYSYSCKECINKYEKEWYNLHKVERLKQVKKRHKEQKKKIRDYLLSLNLKCSVCGESDIRCLDFHHLKDKHMAISQMLANSVSIEKIKKEMIKCIVLCSNCHRKIHSNYN